jgi:hypothetical protein
MSHTVNYCLSSTGKEFFSFLTREKLFLDENFEYFIENDLSLETILFGINTMVEISGATTVIWTSWNYTKFINDEKTRNKVYEWENELKSKLKDYSIIRVDEILLEEFSKKNSELWFNDDKSFTDLLFWLSSQDALHWHKVR